MIPRNDILAEGKTKIIVRTSDRAKVFIRSKDDITAGDGAKRDVLPDKAKYATETTCNCFELLESKGLPTHYIGRMDDQTFCAYRVNMLPYELVARRLATGSYLKRRSDITEGTVFDELVIEFFAKDDVAHDPLLIFDFASRRTLYYDAKKSFKDGFLKEEPMEAHGCPLWQDFASLCLFVEQAFLILEAAWKVQGVTLVDLKIECGRDQTGKLLIADVIDNDSWRIWPGGKKTNMLDKQVYRDLTDTDPLVKAKALKKIKQNYAKVAAMTTKFLIAS